MINIPDCGAQHASSRLTLRKMVFAKSILCAVTLLTGPLASANLVVTAGTDNTGTDNVIANGCDPHVTGPAFTVQGCLNSSPSTFVNFTSDEHLTYTGGQAAIQAVDGTFSYLLIALAPPATTFNKLLLNIDAVADGFVSFLGNPGGTASSPYAISQGGNNKFILTGEDFLSISFFTTDVNQLITDIVSSVDMVSDTKQVRIGGIETVVTEPPIPDVPVPGTLFLMGLGLLGLGCSRRKLSQLS